MPFNPAGVYSLVPGYLAEAGTTIRADQHNSPLEDVAAALSQTLVRDGRAAMTGPLNMNGFAITGAAVGTDPGNVATLAQAMPIGAILDYAGDVAPAGWMLCAGQELNRLAYPLAFAVLGTKFGSNANTFFLPDLRGRATAGNDAMGGVAASRLTAARMTPNGATVGAVGGAQEVALTGDQNGPHIHPSTINDPGHSHGYNAPSAAIQVVNNVGTAIQYLFNNVVATAAAFTGITINNEPSGTGAAHSNVQPTMVMNKIIRVSYDV